MDNFTLPSSWETRFLASPCNPQCSWGHVLWDAKAPLRIFRWTVEACTSRSRSQKTCCIRVPNYSVSLSEDHTFDTNCSEDLESHMRRWCLSTKLHGITSQKAVVLILIAVKFWNLTRNLVTFYQNTRRHIIALILISVNFWNLTWNLVPVYQSARRYIIVYIFSVVKFSNINWNVVPVYRTTRRHIPEDHNLDSHRSEDLRFLTLQNSVKLEVCWRIEKYTYSNPGVKKKGKIVPVLN
jgi:hypothetical protein